MWYILDNNLFCYWNWIFHWSFDGHKFEFLWRNILLNQRRFGNENWFSLNLNCSVRTIESWSTSSYWGFNRSRGRRPVFCNSLLIDSLVVRENIIVLGCGVFNLLCHEKIKITLNFQINIFSSSLHVQLLNSKLQLINHQLFLLQSSHHPLILPWEFNLLSRLLRSKCHLW